MSKIFPIVIDKSETKTRNKPNGIRFTKIAVWFPRINFRVISARLNNVAGSDKERSGNVFTTMWFGAKNHQQRDSE